VKLKEHSHEEIGFRFETVLLDLRYACRQLWMNPGFTVVITADAGLSIGANSAIFSVIDAVMLKALSLSGTRSTGCGFFFPIPTILNSP